MKLSSTIAVSAILLTSAAAVQAENFLDFTVAEGSVPGTPTNTFIADKINGGFTEAVTFTGPNTFSAQAYADMGNFFKDEGTQLVSPVYLNNFEPLGYRLYAVFSATGTFSGLDFTGGTGAFYLYIDVDGNTTKSLTNGLVAPTLVNTSDDYLIAYTTTLVAGTGTLASAPGAYNFDFKDFTLTTGDQNPNLAGDQNGSLYFTDPRPFHVLVQVNGDNDQNTGAGTADNPIIVTGDVSAVFKAPEPGSLALVGLAMLGLGALRRRQAGCAPR